MSVLRYLLRAGRGFLAGNSPQALGAGVALGLCLALMPVLTPQFLILLLIVLFFRVNLPAALAAFLAFELALLPLLPALDGFGSALLAAESLRGLWTFLASTPGLSLLRLNHSIVLAATLLGVALFLPVLLGVSLLAKRYAKPLMDRFLPAPKEEESLKRRLPLRWGALVPAAVIVAVLLAGVLLLRDRFLKPVVVAQAQTAFGARADVVRLSTRLAPSIELENVAVADRRNPMRNLFSFQRLHADLDAGELLAGRVHVTELALEGLAFKTAREESGALESVPAPETEEEAKPAVPDFQERLQALLEKVKKKLEPPALEEFETVQAAREVEGECRKRYERLASGVKNLKAEERLQEFQKTLASLTEKPMPGTLKNLQTRVREIRELAGAREEIDEAREAVERFASLSLAGEKAALERAKTRLDEVRRLVERADDAIQRARRIRKVTILQAPEIADLLEEFEAILRGLGSVPAQLDDAARALDETARGLADKQALIERELQGNGELIGKARTALERSGSRAAELWSSIEADLEGARAEFEAEKTRVFTALGDLEQQIRLLEVSASTLVEGFESDLAYVAGLDEMLVAALEADRRMLEERYDLDAVKGEDLLEPLVGEKAAAWIVAGWRLYERLKPLLEGAPPGSVERAPSPAGPGTVFSFPVATGPPRPAVWVETLRFHGSLPILGRDYELSGRIHDFTTHIGLTGRPVVLEFEASRDGEELRGGFTYDPGGRMVFHVEASGLPVSGVKFRGRYLPREIRAKALRVSMEVTFEAGRAEAAGEIAVEGVTVEGDFEGVDPRFAAVLRDVYGGIREARGRLHLAFERTALTRFEVRTDLADRVAASFKQALVPTLEKAKQAGLELLEGETGEPVREAREAIAVFRRDGRTDVERVERIVASGRNLLQGDRGKIEEKMEILGAVLETEGPPDGDEDTGEIERLEARSEETETRLRDEWARAQERLAEAREGLASNRAQSDESKKNLSEEIERLKELVKKAVPW